MPLPVDPISPQGENAIEIALAYGIDLSLTDYLLSLTPLQRLERHDQALELIRAARAAGREHYGFDPHFEIETKPLGPLSPESHIC